MTSSKLNYLPKAPPVKSPVTLGLRASIYEFKGDTFSSEYVPHLHTLSCLEYSPSPSPYQDCPFFKAQ